MLTYINIKNFAIIKDLELDLQSEMTAITGETGAGKSIIIDSLELALGGRADTSLIRNNADCCEITVMFDLTDIPNAREWLIAKDLDSENECIIRRVIANEGRSKSSINGIPCTQQTLRIFSDFLLSIHGQHENQTLLNTAYQCRLLDAFASNKSLVDKVRNLYKKWFKAKNDLMELENLTMDHQTKIGFLKYQLDELGEIDCSIENLENLRTLQKRLDSFEQFSTNINSVLNLMIESEEVAVLNNLYQIKTQLEVCKSVDPKVELVIELMNNAIIQVEEAVSSLRQNLDDFELDVDNQKRVDDELTQIYTLARKHQKQPEELSEIEASLKQQLEEIQSGIVRLEQAKTLVKEAEVEYLEVAKELSLKRKLGATKLNQLVIAKMQDLGMVGGRFAVSLSPNVDQSFSASGLESVEFLVSANPGVPLQPLNKVASGGELSRISLAIQVITAEKEVTPTLIFDEIDTGIGGKTADIVGRLLRKLAEKAQIVCITHLPQIASQGHNHIAVEKRSTYKRTEIVLTTLDRNERIQEVARMLGGVKITDQTLANAEEMLRAVL